MNADIKRLTAERDSAIAEAVAAEREVWAAQLESRAKLLDGLSYACSFAAEVLRKQAAKMRAGAKP